MILNVTHYSEHCLFFKKKNLSQPLKITETFVECSFPPAQTPAVCVCVLSVREAALPVFLLWCQSSPVASITFLLSMFFTRILSFCFLFVVSFVCLFETRSQVAKVVSKFP